MTLKRSFGESTLPSTELPNDVSSFTDAPSIRRSPPIAHCSPTQPSQPPPRCQAKPESVRVSVLVAKLVFGRSVYCPKPTPPCTWKPPWAPGYQSRRRSSCEKLADENGWITADCPPISVLGDDAVIPETSPAMMRPSTTAPPIAKLIATPLPVILRSLPETPFDDVVSFALEAPKPAAIRK